MLRLSLRIYQLSYIYFKAVTYYLFSIKYGRIIVNYNSQSRKVIYAYKLTVELHLQLQLTRIGCIVFVVQLL